MLNISKHYLGLNGDLLPSLRSMLKLYPTVHEVAWQFNNLPCSSGWTDVGLDHFYHCF